MATLLGCSGFAAEGAKAPEAPRTTAAENAAAESTLSALIDEYERLDREADPITAGQEGDLVALGRLPDVRPETRQRYDERLAALAAQLASLDARELSADAALNKALLERTIALALEGSAFDLARVPFQSDEGFHTLGEYLGRTTVVNSRAEAEAWLARLGGWPAFYAQNLENLRRGIDTGLTQPRMIAERVAAVARAQAEIDPSTSPLLAPFAKLPASISDAEQSELRARALSLVSEQVMPAQRAFADFIAREYLPAARAELAWRSVPEGEASYRFLVRRETSTALEPEEIHRLGVSEVARIRSRMEETIAQSGFRGSFAEFVGWLRSDRRFYADSEAALLERASEIAKRADDRLPRVFGTLPRLPYGVRPVPSELADGYTSGRYWPGSPALGQSGGYMVNTSKLDQRPLYELPALTLHEAVPGHHLQIALAQELIGLPYFRRNAAPTAFIEGWALYAEFLGEELGLYRDAYERFGRYSFEMWRACRLVADTGIHWLGWDMERARACLRDNTALAPHNIQTELERYVAWPAQALAYKLGELRLRALRERAESALGGRFELRRFHDAVLLGGALPLPLLDAQVDGFIAREQARR